MDAVKIPLVIVSLVAIFTNGISLYFLYKRRRKSNYVILCINLSLSDLLQSVAGYIPALFLETNLQRASTLCKLSAFFIALPSFASIALLTSIALSRMVLLNTPFLSNEVSYKMLFLKIGVFSWLYALIWAALPLMGFSSYTVEATKSRCSINFSPTTASEKAYLILLISSGFLIPCIIILVSCLFTASVMRTMFKYFSHTYGKENVETKRYKAKEKSAFSSFVLMVLSFVICWTPYATIGCMSAFTSIKVPNWLLHCAAFFAKSAAFVNPFIYYWKDGLFKKLFVRKKSNIMRLFLIKSRTNNEL